MMRGWIAMVVLMRGMSQASDPLCHRSQASLVELGLYNEAHVKSNHNKHQSMRRIVVMVMPVIVAIETLVEKVI